MGLGKNGIEATHPANIADLIVAKHRNGRVGSIKLYFEERFVKFENLSTYELTPAR